MEEVSYHDITKRKLTLKEKLTRIAENAPAKDDAGEQGDETTKVVVASGKKKVVFDDAYILRIYKLSLLGLNETQIAEVLNISKGKLRHWKKRYPMIEDALRKGKEIASSEVAFSLFNKATGFSKMVEAVKLENGKWKRIKYEKYFPPDTQAATFWLSNKEKGDWGTRQEINNNLNLNLNLAELTDEELKMASKIGLKALDAQNTIDVEFNEDEADEEGN